MSNNLLAGIIFAIIAYFILALGFVLQKKGIAIFSPSRKKQDTFFWVLGFILININPVFNFLSLLHIPSYLVNAISGLTIVFTVFLSALLLREKIYKSDILFTILMVISIFNVTFFNSTPTQTLPPKGLVLLFTLLPIVLFLLTIPSLFLKKTNHENQNFSFFVTRILLPAFSSGSMSGFMVILMKLVQLEKGNTLSLSYLHSLYLYLFLTHGIVSFIAIQVAYKYGKMVAIAPIQYGAQIVYPILASYLLFSLDVVSLQIAGFVLLTFCVVMIVRRHTE